MAYKLKVYLRESPYKNGDKVLTGEGFASENGRAVRIEVKGKGLLKIPWENIAIVHVGSDVLGKSNEAQASTPTAA